MRRPKFLRLINLVLLVTILVVGLTPVGLHLAMSLGRAAAQSAGWSLLVGNISGSLLGGATLSEIRAESAQARAAIKTVQMSITSWSVDANGLQLRWNLQPPDSVSTSPAQDVTIPAYLPQISIRGANIDVASNDTILWSSQEVELDWQPPKRGQGRLDLFTSGVLTTAEIPTSVRASLYAVSRESLIRVHLEELELERDSLTVIIHHGSVVVDLDSALSMVAQLNFLISPTQIEDTQFPASNDESQQQAATSADNADSVLSTQSRSQVDVSLTGTLRPVTLSFTALFDGENLWTGPFKGEGSGGLDSGAVWLDALNAELAEGSLAGSGRFDFESGPDATATVVGFELASLISPLQGKANADATISTSSEGSILQLAIASDSVVGLAPVAVDLQAEMRFAGDRVQGRLRSSILGEVQVEGTIDDVARLDLQGILRADPWLDAPVPVAVEGHLHSAILDVTLEADDLPLGDSLGTTSARIHLDGDQLDINLRTAGGTLTASASIDLPTSNVDDLHITAQQFDLRRLNRSMEGVLEGSLGGSGSINFDVKMRTSMRVDSLRIEDWLLDGALDLSARTENGELQIDAHNKGFDLNLRADRDSLFVTSSVPGASVLSSDDSVFIRGHAALTMPWDDLSKRMGMVAIESMSIHHGMLTAQTQRPLQIELQSGSLQMTESLWSSSLGPVRFAVQGEDGEWLVTGSLDSLQSPFRSWEARAGRARFSVAGSFPYPQIELAVDAQSLQLQGHDLGALSVRVDLNHEASRSTLTLDRGSESTLTASLTSPVHLLDPSAHGEHSVRLVVTASDYVVSNAAVQTRDSTSITLVGKLDAALPLSQLGDSGDWSHWQGATSIERFRVELPRGRLRLTHPATARLDAGALTVETVSLELEVNQLDTVAVGSVELAGLLDTMVSNLRLRLRDVDLESAAKLLAIETELAGRIGGEAVFTGTPERPALDVEAELQLDELGQATMRIRGRPLGWNAMATWKTPAQDELTASIGIPPDSLGWPDWAAGQMRLRSTGLELTALLDQWGELDELAGRVEVDLDIVDLLQPQVQGSIDIEALQLALLDMSPGFRFATGQIRFEGASEGRLSGFSGTSTENSGRLELTGAMRWPTMLTPELDLRLLLDDIPYRYADIFHVDDVDADLNWQQRDGGGRLSGFVRLNEPTALVQLVTLTSAVVPPPSVQNELLERTQLDLFIDIDEMKTISEISDVVLDGGIRLYGTLSKPRFQGELDISRGHLLLLSRRFDFDHGRIITDRLVPTHSILDIAYDPLLLDPELDLKATANVFDKSSETNREVTLELRGTAREAAPILTSPGLGDTEVLNLLAFGDPLAENAGGDVLAVAAGQLLLSRQARRAGLDEFQLLSSGTVLGTTIGKQSIRVGKYLDWPLSMWLRYEGVTTEMGTGQLEAEYRITNLFKIDARTNSDRGVYGVGLVIEKDF